MALCKEEKAVRKKISQQNWRDNNKDKIRAANKKWNTENSEYKKAKHKKYVLDYPELNRARRAKRRAVELQRTVGWSDYLVIKMIYEDCPEGYEVDHIIPLQGEVVSGLHVAWNLQYLTAEENRSKGNKYVEE
jgi:hypothetical protein